MKGIVLFTFVLMVMIGSISAQWSSAPGPYGTDVSSNYATTTAYATHGGTAGVFSLSGNSEWNGMQQYFVAGKFWKNFSESVPLSVLADMRLLELQGADSLNLSFGIIIQDGLGKASEGSLQKIKSLADEKRKAGERDFVLKINGLVYISVSKNLTTQWESIPIDLPEEHQAGTLVVVEISATSIALAPSAVNAKILLDNVRLQYDYAGNIKLIDSFGDDLTGVDNEKAEKTFSLSQNYPNPFNPTTNIAYRISNTAQVTVKIYDILGNEVATLVNEEKPAGEYTVKFNASGLASGTYFYVLRAGSLALTKKMALLK